MFKNIMLKIYFLRISSLALTSLEKDIIDVKEDKKKNSFGPVLQLKRVERY